MVFNSNSQNFFGGNQTTLFGSKVAECPPKSPFLRPEASPAIFGQQVNTPFGTPISNQQPNFLFNPPQQSNSTVGFTEAAPQQNTNVFGNQTSQEKLDKNNSQHSKSNVSNSQKLDSILQQHEFLNAKIDNLFKGLNELKPDKELYVACPLHEHPIIETTCNKINENCYNNGFSCDICKIQISNKDTIMYHCKNCHQVGKLFDTCETCIRNCLKMH
jgi:hypothetical protein